MIDYQMDDPIVIPKKTSSTISGLNVETYKNGTIEVYNVAGDLWEYVKICMKQQATNMTHS